MELLFSEKDISNIANLVVEKIKPLLQYKGPEPLMDMAQAAKYMGISTATLYTMVRKKEIPYVKVGRLNRFRASQLDVWMGDAA